MDRMRERQVWERHGERFFQYFFICEQDILNSPNEKNAQLTPKICSSSSSVKTVPVTWFPFNACQFNNGILNLVWMAFLPLIPEERENSEQMIYFLLPAHDTVFCQCPYQVER